MHESCGVSSQNPNMPTCHARRISWSAIVVGALIGVGLSFLLNLFSIAIGLSMVKMDPDGLQSLAIGGFVGLLIGTVVAMYSAGFAAGFLGKNYCPKRNLGVVYGFTTWCLALVLVTIIAQPLGRYVSMYANFISNPQVVVTPAMPRMLLNHEKMRGTAPTMPQMAMNQKSVNEIGMGSLFIFVLFFVGALASCFGGHAGMTCECPEKRE